MLIEFNANQMTKHIPVNIEGVKQINLSYKADIDICFALVHENIISKTINPTSIDVSFLETNLVDLIILPTKNYRDDVISFEFDYQCEMKEMRIHKGDFHIHTNCSADAIHSPDDLITMALDRGMDFIAFSDHNSMAANLTTSTDITVIPSIELTNKYGHCNFLGVIHPIETVKVANVDEEISKIAEARANGAYFSVNHPFSPKSRSWMIDLDKHKPDFVEIWNGPWEMHNRIAFEWWISKLCCGIYIPAIGGSDFHFETEGKHIGRPTTNVLSYSNKMSDILSGVRNGRVYLSDAMIDIGIQNSHIGDIIEEDKLKYSISTQLDSYYLNIYSNLGIQMVKCIGNQIGEIDMTDKEFAVIAITDSEKRDRDFHLITNPIFTRRFKW